MFIENEDYPVGQVSQPVKQGGFSTKKSLERLMLIENEDYLVANVGQQSETTRGIK